VPEPWFADRTRDRLLQLVVEGTIRSQGALAEALGVSKPRVRQILKQEGIEISYRAETTRDRLPRLASRGARSQSELARRPGVSRQRIHQIVKEEGIAVASRPPKSRCAQCGRTLLNPSGRSALDGLCAYCRGGKLTVVCPTCGKARGIFKSDYKTRNSDLCKVCVEPERKRRAKEALARLRAARQ
jgi:biotin operon repressor